MSNNALQPDVWAVRLAGILGASGVALGAFAAHAMRDGPLAAMLPVLETSVRYQLLHALALLALAALPGSLITPRQRLWLVLGFASGTLLFCASLDLMVFTGWRALGAVTPLGGVVLIASWIGLAWSAWASRR